MIISSLNTSSTDAIMAKVDIYNGATLVKTCTCSDDLQDFTINRDGDSSKFFGYGICQKLSVNLIDMNRQMNFDTSNHIEIVYSDGENYDHPYPYFNVSEVSWNEKENILTLTAYDLIYKASNHTFSELGLTAPYTLKDVAEAAGRLLGASVILPEDINNLEYPEGANFEGTENLRSVLDAIAEVTQTIYYVTNLENNICFKRLKLIYADDYLPDFNISKADYFELDVKESVKLSGLCNATELGDDVESNVAGDNTSRVQYIRDNPFWELRTDIDTLLNQAMWQVVDMSIPQFTCTWAGNHCLEIGDRIDIETESGDTIQGYLLDDTINYDGFLEEITKWEFSDNQTESVSNPVTLGEKLNQTFARVDKANKQISLVASATSTNSAAIQENTSAISQLQLTTESITASVSSTKTELLQEIESTNENLQTLTQEVSLKMSPEAVDIAISESLKKGVDTVTTTTGFTFNADGLTVSKSDSEISTIISEDGMTIKKQNEEVLVADNQGVRAEDLHATTYLIIGNNSRLQDQGNRTACYWLGD